MHIILKNVSRKCLLKSPALSGNWLNGMKNWPSPKGRDFLCDTPALKYVFIAKHQAEFSCKYLADFPAKKSPEQVKEPKSKEAE